MRDLISIGKILVPLFFVMNGVALDGMCASSVAEVPGFDPVVATIESRVIKESELQLMINQLSEKTISIDSQRVLTLMIKRAQLALKAAADNQTSSNEFNFSYDAYLNEKTVIGDLEQDVKDRVLFEAYQRSQFMLRVSHLLVPVGRGADDGEVDAAFGKAQAIYKSIQTENSEFTEMVEKYSDKSDESTFLLSTSELDYFTVFEQVYPFETVAFSLEPGETSMPFRSRFGFHLIKLLEKYKLDGVKTAAQILMRSDTEAGSAKERIEILRTMAEDQDFAELAETYSEDTRSSVSGGDLGTGRLINELEKHKMLLNTDEVSEPVQTSLGWHILKVTESEPFPSYVETVVELEEKIGLDNRLERHMLAVFQDVVTSTIVETVKVGYREYLLAESEMKEQFSSGEPESAIELLMSIDKHSAQIDALNLDQQYPAVLAQ